MATADQIGRLDRRRFFQAHNDTMHVQPLFKFPHAQIRPNTFAYDPCWGILDPGMAMEAHAHPTPEFYVFTNGQGEMTLGNESITVEAGMAVNVPPDMTHSVANPTHAVEPLIWVSLGFLPATE